MATKDFTANGILQGFGAANGDSDTIPWNGPGTAYASGTFGGGTLKLQARPMGSSAAFVDVDATNCKLTAAGFFNFELYGQEVKLNLAGATAPVVVAGLCR